MTNLVSQLREVVRDHPEETALSVAGHETTYAQLWGMTGRFAAGLVERGVEPDDAVALYLPNLPQYVVGFYGTLRAGGVAVPTNPQYESREIRHLLADSGAVAVMTTTDRVQEIADVHDDTDVQFIVTADGEGDFSTGFADFLGTDANFDFWELAGREDDQLAALPYTSGTTGDPRGVQLTHGNLASNAAAMADLVPDGIGPGDGSLGALPLFHTYGLTVVMNATLLEGGTFFPMVQWDAGEALRLVEDEQIDILHGVPAMYTDMLHHAPDEAFDLSSVRLAGVGGSAMTVEVLERFEERFGVTVYEGYGLTETSPVTHFNAPAWGRRVGSIGKTIPGVEARVVDEDFEPVDPIEEGPLAGAAADLEEGPLAGAAVDLDEVTGELVVAGPNVMAGYHGLPGANEAAFTEADGERWFHTGDVGYHDEDGYFYVVDRMTDVVVTGGYTVYPREVEELLFEHEAVADAAVVGVPASEASGGSSDRPSDGVPDDNDGETVVAFVVPAPDADVSPADLQEYCMENLAAYKHPRVVEFVDALPRTTTGTVQKFALRDEHAGAVQARLDEGADGEQDGDTGIPDEIEDISGVGPTKGETLRDAGFESVEDVVEASPEDLAEVDGIGDALADQIKDDVVDDD